jgi:hypothetical protein
MNVVPACAGQGVGPGGSSSVFLPWQERLLPEKHSMQGVMRFAVQI